MLGSLLLLALLLLALAQASLPPGTCSVEGQACEAHQDNLLAAQGGVESLLECEMICVDKYDCKFITYFGSENYCMLFRDCDTLAECEDCITGAEFCLERCGQRLEGPLEENVLDNINDVQDQLVCKAACRNSADCQAYIYYDLTDLALPGRCFLLAEVLGPLLPCDHCFTGFPDCRNVTGVSCGFTVETNTTILTRHQFTEPGNTTVNISPLAVLTGDCELSLLAVGGGGSGPYAGGGSGYLASTSTQVPAPELLVAVGGAGQESSVWGGADQVLLTAQPGQGENGHGHGGAGYSGGGGAGSYGRWGDGGWGGGDGGGKWGGSGSGVDLSSISLSQFSLSPGAGGRKHSCNDHPNNPNCGGHWGGGGGGVLVDGAGPRDKIWDGAGYGGGQGGYWGGHETPGSPGPGIVIVEIKKKQ